MNFINSEIENYCLKFSTKETKLLQKLTRETNYKILMPRMMSSHYMGLFLKMITSFKKPKKILEIGMFTGYSTICLAKELAEEGELHTIEKNEEIIDFASKFIKESNLDHKINIHNGDAKYIIPKLTTKYDLIFIDADKKNYCLYYDLCVPKLKKGGHILIDNVLWSGKVISKLNKNDRETVEIKNLNKKILEDKRFENIILPIRDGLMICKLI